MTETVLLVFGLATYMNPGVAEAVTANRIDYGHVAQGADPGRAVALLDREHVGKTVWLQAPGGRVVEVVVVDCASGHDRARLERTGWAVDLSWELAVELGVVDGPVNGFRVWDRDPRSHQER
jgi:hypothetical protein